MRARIDITEVERATKIRTKYLRALEDEEWGVLPGPTFAKSFLRTYADYLGLDSRLLVEEFKRRHDRPAEAELAPLAPAPRGGGGGGGGRRTEVIAVVVVLVLVLAGLYALGQVGGGNDEGSTVAGRTGTQPHRPARRHRPHRPAVPQRARVELTATGAVYVCAVDERGRKLIPGVTLSAGAAPRVIRGKRVRLTLGNDSVKMQVNGKTVPVPASATPLSYEVTPHGRRLLPARQAPSCA